MTHSDLHDSSPPQTLQAIADTLADVRRSGSFCASGQHSVPVGGLSIDGFGPLPLPLIPAVAAALEPLSTPAPYGRGGETLLDPDVRRCRQIAADRVGVGSPAWQAMLEQITADAAAGLGVDGPVQAHLYKLLLYGPGDFFVPHRDSEKEDGMLGTLVVVLPSDFSGGALVVSHGGARETLGLQASAPDQVTWAAFYADCLHEIQPLQDGVRAVLVYNLVRTGDPQQPPDHSQAEARLQQQLAAWRQQSHPVKLCYALEHRYTPAELGWSHLKGVDLARAQVLARAAQAQGMTVRLAMVSVSESWSAEQTYYGSWRDRYAEPDPDPIDVDLVDLFDQHHTVDHWRSPSGKAAELPELGFDLDEVIPAGALDQEEPDDFYFQEATGNEGATVERTFRRAAVVIWPPEHDVFVLAQGGVDALLDRLDSLPPDADDRAQILAAAAAPLLRGRHERRHAALLTCIADRGLDTAAQAWLDCRRAEDLLAPDLGPPLAQALDLLSPDQASRGVAKLVSGGDWNSLGPHAVVVDALLQHGSHPPRTWATALDALLARLRQGPVSTDDRWWRPRALEPAHLTGLLHLVVLVQPSLGEQLLDLVQDHPQLIGFDHAVVPAVVAVAGSVGPVDALSSWIDHVRSILQPRMDDPPQPPLDLRRTAPTGCPCGDCALLAEFMQDPAREELQLKRRKDLRKHLHRVVGTGLDARTHTIRTGSPYTIVVTKTLASYQRQVATHRRDQHALAALQ